VGEQQRRDVVVVGDDVALRHALGRPEDLVEVRETDLAAVDLDPPDVGALPGDRQLTRLFDRERGTAPARGRHASPR
jgi:hypothetical protein